ncbi:TRAP transporter large permease subunit [Vineibacter terrae]|uniref:TRAP transporter large permease subunit n=1 Tax=Vineibacter terrae TaxID=2586908 RepID=A0A5C8PPS9_9HYPH|nr:TRAP transporter large permease subunit [Vineibacter terrae]TXL76423.1 TRAP transporter large permease subunit [Vineibacter terrae]
MSEAQAAGQSMPLRAAGYLEPGRAVVMVASLFAWLAALGVVFMTVATVYDVCVRYFLNSPTTWATEVSTYVLIATIFFGAAYTHLADGNVRVSVILARLRPEAARDLGIITAWLGLLYVGIAGWQSVLMVISDYQNGARIFSLLLTPSWMPKAPIAIGLCLLAAALVAEIDRLSPHRPRWQRLAPYAIFAAVAALLVAFGTHPPVLPGTRFDLGSIAILLAVTAGAFLAGGPRVGASVLAIAAASIALFVFGKSLGAGFLTAMLFVGIVFFLAIGVRIAFALALVGMLAVYFLTPAPFPITLPDRAWSGVNSFSLTAVPLYVLMGAFLVRSGLSNELFSVMAKLLARLPGGLAHAATAGCAVFAAVSGSSVATAATVGTVACPEMIRRGYSEKLSYGTVAAGGTLGILIPPSVPMIIYATSVGVPVAKLFIAGILPGLLMTLFFMMVILAWALTYPAAAPALPRGTKIDLTRDSAIDSGLVVLLILLIIVSLYAGLATASETGALGAFLAFAICWGRHRLDRSVISAALLETVVVTSFIFLIVVGANIITFGFDYLKISQKLMAAAVDAEVHRWLVFLIIVLVYIVLGAFLDSISMLVLTLPVVFPVIQALGFDPIWFGVVLVIMAEVGLIHPPMGMNLFVLQGIGKGVAMRTIAVGALPFLGAMFLTVVVLCLFPEIALFLTRHLE